MHQIKCLQNSGTVCAKEATRFFCPTSGDSGSILMTENSNSRFEAEGILSFIKGCDELFFGKTPGSSPDSPNWKLFQVSTSPTVYTKLYCYLKWIANQYDLEYTIGEFDEVNIFFCKNLILILFVKLNVYLWS